MEWDASLPAWSAPLLLLVLVLAKLCDCNLSSMTDTVGVVA